MSDNNPDVQVSPTPGSVKYQTYRARWYILALFSAMCFHQNFVWNTFGPIERGLRYAYPNWNADTVAIMANWGTITFVVGVGPICWILNRMGLRFASLLSSGIMAIGTVVRLFAWSDVEIFLYTSHLCSILNGFTGVVVMAAPAALAAAWFPAHERATAISVSQTFFVAGNGASFLFGPLIVPDYFLNRTSATIYGPEIPIMNYNRTYPTPDEEKVLVWYYMVSMAVLSVLIFVPMALYFPSRPKTPPTASASYSVPRTVFVHNIMMLIKDKDVMLCLIGFSFSNGVQGVWASVMTMNFETLGVDDEKSGYIGIAAMAANIIIGISVGRFIDYVRRNIKWILVFILLVSAAGYAWLTLIVLRVLPDSLIQLYASTILGTGCTTAIMTLFFEYTVEMSYPVPEGIIGGLLTGGSNLIGCIFLSLFMIPKIHNASVAWMNCALCVSTGVGIPFVLLTEEKYARSHLDDLSCTNKGNKSLERGENSDIRYRNAPYYVMQ